MAFDIMRLTPLGSASIWYCQPGDWERLKEDLPEMQNSNSFIDSLLLNLHRMCIKAEKTLLETLTGTGNLAVAQAAFSTYGKRSQQTTTRAESIWATMFLNFQLLDCLLWYRNCSLEGCVRPTAKQLPLGVRSEVEKELSKYYEARFNWQAFLPDFITAMKKQLEVVRRNISEIADEDVVSLLSLVNYIKSNFTL